MNKILTSKKSYGRKLLCGFLLVLISYVSKAQLCTGSLGDPVVNITFGSGSPEGPPLNAATTSYKYIANDCPNDGSYAVRNSTANCFGSWHTITSDHTGNPRGCFMLVNASFEPGDFYVETVKGLCANTTYEFAAWVMNVLRAANQIKPNITFTIEKTDGTILGLFNTGDIGVTGTPQWKQYGFNFKTPPNTFEVVLRIRNNAPGGIGNDIALDDITFRPCGPLLSNIFSGNADTISICEGDEKPFDFSVTIPPFFSNSSVQWQLSKDKGETWNDIAGATSLTLSVNPKGEGNYWYRITVGERENFNFTTCRVASDITAINITPLPKVNAGNDKVVIKGEHTNLQGGVEGTVATVSWKPSDHMEGANLLTPRVNPEADIIYTLTAESQFGCIASDTVSVKVINGIYIPTSFTPNGDGLNDVWRIPFIDHATNSDVKIFNRYGELIYQASNSSVAWDGTIKGKLQPSGVYVYIVKLRKDSPELKGFITLIR